MQHTSADLDQMAGRVSAAELCLVVMVMLLLDVLTGAAAASAFFTLLAMRGRPAHPMLSPITAARHSLLFSLDLTVEAVR